MVEASNFVRAEGRDMKSLIPYAGILVLILSLFSLSFYLANPSFFHTFGQASVDHLSQPSLWRTFLLVVSTLLGIIGGYAHVRFQAIGKHKLQLKQELTDMFHSPDFYRGLFASPIVFSVIYVAANQQPDGVIAALLAFENGFFWNRVLERHIGASEPKSMHQGA